eukprot:6177605-Pleurochrysis_carterae.AAC.3
MRLRAIGCSAKFASAHDACTRRGEASTARALAAWRDARFSFRCSMRKRASRERRVYQSDMYRHFVNMNTFIHTEMPVVNALHIR